MARHRPKKGRSAKRARAKTANADDEYAKYPHSFIFNKNKVGKNVSQLITDFRKVMEPFTATSLKARPVNKLKDFVDIGMLFNVSHLLMFSKTERGIYLRVGRLPQGPTLTFRVTSYSLIKDVVNSLKKHHTEAKQFFHHALLIMNNFGGDALKHKLVSSMFQNMFPSIHVDKAKLNHYKRCVVLSYNEENDTIEFRHYNIRVAPLGLSRPVKKLLKAKMPDLSKCSDISDFLLKPGNLSESEAEMDGPMNEVVLPQFVSGRGNIASSKSAIRLTEIGPRMTLSLVRIVEGLCDGEVLFGPSATKTTKKRKLKQKLAAKKRKLEENQDKLKKKEDDKDSDDDDDDDDDDERDADCDDNEDDDVDGEGDVEDDAGSGDDSDDVNDSDGSEVNAEDDSVDESVDEE